MSKVSLSPDSPSGVRLLRLTVRFWADLQVIHLCIAGVQVKSVISHLTVADLARLTTAPGRDAGRPAAHRHPTGLAG